MEKLKIIFFNFLIGFVIIYLMSVILVGRLPEGVTQLENSINLALKLSLVFGAVSSLLILGVNAIKSKKVALISALKHAVQTFFLGTLLIFLILVFDASKGSIDFFIKLPISIFSIAPMVFIIAFVIGAIPCCIMCVVNFYLFQFFLLPLSKR